MSGLENQNKIRGGRQVDVSPELQAHADTLGKELDRKAKKFQEEYPVVVETLKESIASIDFGLLKQIFMRHANRSGVDRGNLNWPQPTDIAILSKDAIEDDPAMFDSTLNRIFITPASAWNELYAVLREPSERSRFELAAKLLFLITHEYVHATGFIATNEVLDENAGSRAQYIAGYSAREFAFDETHAVKAGAAAFEVFNEGVVTRITDQIIEEYIKSGGTPGLQKPVEYFQSKNTAPGRYVLAAELVEDVVEKIAQTTGTPKNVVWEAVLGGHFSGEWVQTDESVKLLQETLGTAIFEDLAHVRLDRRKMKKVRSKVRRGLPKMNSQLGKRWLQALYPHLVHKKQ